MMVTVEVDDFDAGLTIVAARALYSLAASQVGASIAKIEQGDIALSELIESLEETRTIKRVGIESAAVGFELTLSLEAGPISPVLGAGSEQIIDGGFDAWSLTANAATVSVRGSQWSDA